MRLRRFEFDDELRSHVVLFATLAAGLVFGIAVNNLFLGEAIGLLAFLVVQLVRRLLMLRRPALHLPQPPTWHRSTPVYGRDSEVAEALGSVLAGGVVAIVGPRDIGTSAVAEAVVDSLIDEHGAEVPKTFRFDLRSRSSRRPDDARATAGRIVSPFRLAEPANDSDKVLANAGSRLATLFADKYDVLMLDNVSVPEEVAWLVRQWPRGGRPWLVVAGESALGSIVDESTVFVGELDLPSLRAMWEAELRVPDPRPRDRLLGRLKRLRGGDADRDELDRLLEACLGRPRAIKAFAREIMRPDSTVTVESLLSAVRSTGPVEGPLERVWTAILDHLREGLPDDAVWLLHALAELPVTALTSSAIAAMLVDNRRAEVVLPPLEELRIRNLVQETEGRYRLPTEIRRAIAGTRVEDDRRAVALRAVPALLRHYVEHTDRWAGRLESGSASADAEEWFRDAELSLRPLFGQDNYLDEKLLTAVTDELAHLADALEVWYLREQQSSGLLAVNDGLQALAVRADRPDLAGLAAIRMATAHRMAGRLGKAGELLEIAKAHAARTRDDRVRAELDMREHIERALLCLTAGTGLREAEAELDRVLASRRSGADRATTAALLNLGALCLRQKRPDDALDHLRRAEQLAGQVRDIGCEAQAIELQGVAMSQQGDELHQVVPLWQRAMGLFVHIGETQGEARCLQHLGSAALADPMVAGRLRDGHPTALSEQDAAEVALPRLKRSKLLRAGQPDTGLVDSYLELARKRLGLAVDEA